MSERENANPTPNGFTIESRILQEQCLLYFKRYRNLHPLPPGWTERYETYSDFSRQLVLTDGKYHVKLYPGDIHVEPRAYFTPPDPFSSLPAEQEVEALFVQLFGNELGPIVVEHYVKLDGSNEFIVFCEHPADPSDPDHPDSSDE